MDIKGVILIIDDNITNIRVIVKHLNHHGFETLIARNGEMGLERARISQPDLILLDVLMPGMDGFETCRRLKTDELTKDIPVLFMTVLTETSDKLKGFEAGGVDYVTKPIQEEEVLARITTHLKLRNLQKRLEVKNETLRCQAMLLNQIRDSIVATDLEGRITYVNQAAAQSLKRTQAELIGRTVHSFGQNTETGVSQDEIIWETKTHGKWQGRVVNHDKYGSKHIFDSRTWLINDPDKNPTGMVGISADVTEQALMQEELKKYSERLEEMVEERTEELRKAQKSLLAKERLAVMGHFAGSISHEIRNPLAAIDASVYFLKMKPEQTDEKTGHHLERISSNIRKITATIESLLNLARMETPKTQSVDLIKLINETLSSSKLPDTVSLAANFPDRPVFVPADPEQIRMALKNIVKNAVQAMDGSGKLAVSLNLPETGHAEIAVNDTGPGIRPEHIGNIFEPLFTTKAHGTGFGLSIVKMIIENHGGSVRAESEPGKGAALIFTLPCDGTISGPDISQAFSDAENGADTNQSLTVFNSSSILVADDLEENRGIIKDFLKDTNIDILEAPDGEKALELIKTHLPDLVLTDIRMPGRDGYETAQTIKTSDKLKHIPVIAFTAHAIKTDMDKISQLFDGYLPKQPDRNRLIAELKRFLPFQTREPLPEDADKCAESLPDHIPGIDLSLGLKLLKNRALYLEMLAGLNKKYANLSDEIRIAADRGDTESVRNMAHTVKGLAGSLGAEALHDAAYRLETAAEERRSELDNCLSDFQTALSVVLQSSAMISRFREKADSPPASKSPDGNAPDALFAELRNCLRSGSAKSGKILASVRPYIETEQNKNLFQEIENLIYEYDFDGALERLELVMRDA